MSKVSKDEQVERIHGVYTEAVRQAAELPHTISFGGEFEFELIGFVGSGSHRIRRTRGGYGSLLYKNYNYGNFSFYLTRHDDYPAPYLDVTLKKELADGTHRNLSLKYYLTERAIKEVGVYGLLENLFDLLNLDYDSAIEANDYSNLFGSITDKTYIGLAINLIMDVRKHRLDNSKRVLGIQDKIESLGKQITALMQEEQKLYATHTSKSDDLRKQLNDQYIPAIN